MGIDTLLMLSPKATSPLYNYIRLDQVAGTTNYYVYLTRSECNKIVYRPDAYNVKELSLPAFPLDVVREVVIEALDMAAEVNLSYNVILIIHFL